MPEPEVRLIAARQEHLLGLTPTVVRSGPVVLAVSGLAAKTIMIDGAPTRLTSGLATLDLTRSTGYHRVRAGDSDVWFATADDKLGLAGIEEMLAELRSAGTGWTGQMLFSKAAQFRDPHVVFGWLDRWADRLLDTCESIVTAPTSERAHTQRTSRRGGPRMLRTATLRMIRTSPRDLLTPSPVGPLEIEHNRYTPLKVVVRSHRPTLDSIANRRVKATLVTVQQLAEEVYAASPDNAARARCRAWSVRAQRLLARPTCTAIARDRAALAQPRQPVEMSDPRYREVWVGATDLRDQFGWSPTVEVSRRLSYVQSADSIYQAFAATCLAANLGMTQTSAVLGTAQPAFTSADLDLYFNTRPPEDVLRSWRFHGPLPDESRPDLLLHERKTGRVALLDAKYRLSTSGHATEDSRKEVTSYLGLYGLDSVGIAFPGDASAARTISGKGQSIVEVPITPGSDLAASIGSILGILQAPAF